MPGTLERGVEPVRVEPGGEAEWMGPMNGVARDALEEAAETGVAGAGIGVEDTGIGVEDIFLLREWRREVSKSTR